MESDLIAHFRKRTRSDHPAIEIGPGDDAAVLRLLDTNRFVVTVDLLTDQVDFELDKIDPRRVGHKALAVNLSDLAAMAARPLGVVAAVALPEQGGKTLAEELVEGMLPLAERFGSPIVGGDVNSWPGPLAISITAFGTVTEHGPLTRSGAKPGDRILVTGTLGGSILGHHLDFIPRVDEALLLNERYDLHAGIDISDGLSTDLNHLCEESGCGAIVQLASVPISEAAREKGGDDALGCALHDGEDFELLLAVPPEVAEKMLADQPLGEVQLTEIGHFVEGSGLQSVDNSGKIEPLVPRGWEHRTT
ncbi:MAG: thiamine-phosphate kinase [Planctomycetia bacterium]|jgi:thiamine-monophosphate kinase